MTFGVEMATEALASLTSQVEAIVAGASVSTQPTTVTTTPQQQDANEDYYARIDALLFRDPLDRAAHLSDYRSNHLRELFTTSTP